VAWKYHTQTRCGYDILAMKTKMNSMGDDHEHFSEAQQRLIEEKRRCSRDKLSYFQDEFYSICMENGSRVLKVAPTITAAIIGVIVWLLQRGPLSYGTFKKPSFLFSLFAILILVSANFADFITSFVTLSHKTLTTDREHQRQCGHAPAVMSLVASSACLLSSICVGCFIVLIYMTRIETLDYQIKNLKEPTAPSSKDSSVIYPPVAGEPIKAAKTKKEFHDAKENLTSQWNQCH